MHQGEQGPGGWPARTPTRWLTVTPVSTDRHSQGAERPLRVLVDGTPLLGQRSGIGRYTVALLRELAARSDVAVTVTAFTARGQVTLRGAVPGGVAVRGAPVPASALRALWDFLSPPQRDLTDLVKRSVARAAIVCTPSDAVAQQVARWLGVPVDRIVVTPLGVDRSWLDAAPPTEALRARLGLPPQYLLFVGAAQPRKGLDVAR